MDFNSWKDEDEEDDGESFNMPGMSGFGGAGGAGGMDFEAVSKSARLTYISLGIWSTFSTEQNFFFLCWKESSSIKIFLPCFCISRRILLLCIYR